MSSIKVPETPKLKHKSDYFRDGLIALSIIGKTGCGKTYLLASILPLISDKIETVFIATAIDNVPVHKAIREYFRNRGIYCEIAKTPNEALNLVEEAVKRGYVTLQKQGLLIFDDFKDGSEKGPYWKFTVHAFNTYRNHGWNFIILAQQPKQLDTDIRNNTTMRIFFNCYSVHAVRAFSDDIAARVPDQEAFDKLIEYTQSVPYSYVMVRDNPFEVSAGKLLDIKTALTSKDVVIPTLNDLMKEMGVRSPAQLEKKSAEAQMEAGNTSRLVRSWI